MSVADFTAKDVQRLRQMTGAGMLDCKKALDESDGDIEKAAQLLREQGKAGAAKRSDREASEGAVAAVRSATEEFGLSESARTYDLNAVKDDSLRCASIYETVGGTIFLTIRGPSG